MIRDPSKWHQRIAAGDRDCWADECFHARLAYRGKGNALP